MAECNIRYESWQMQCCGEPLTVGEEAELTCLKPCVCSIFASRHIDFDEEHHGGANCRIRGRVKRIQAVFIDKYANEGQRWTDDPDNEYTTIDVSYVDGYEDCENYGTRSASDVSDYIITLEDFVELPNCDNE